MQSLLSDIESKLDTPERGDFLVELASIMERYITDRADEMLVVNPEVYEIPSLLTQLATAVDTSLTDEL